MITLLISVVLLILGYVLYGRVMEHIYRPDKDRRTPAIALADGVDYVVMPGWKIFMIQFLNIAGTGPIFGAILGAKYGPACYLWIVLGCIFGGAVHDYLSAMLSLRHDGINLPTIIGKYLGKETMNFYLFFPILLLLLVGAVFVYSPAIILGGMTHGGTMIWVVVILIYYILATMIPIDKIIGKIYPLFAISLIFMAVALFICLITKWPTNIPEIWDGLSNRSPESGSIFPCMFITIACGAISGFHATQSPLMARCIKNETMGRPIFYGAMITEGIIALIWATIASYFFYGGGSADFASDANTAPEIVMVISESWLNTFGATLALLGVVAAPITSGDTALRSCRLIIADIVHLNQKPIKNRLIISIPIFIISGALLWYNISNEEGFNTIWRYFGWANQTLSIFTFWALTVFLYKARKGYWYILTLFPAAFMTSVCMTFIATQEIGFNLPDSSIPYVGIISFVISIICFITYAKKTERSNYEL